MKFSPFPHSVLIGIPRSQQNSLFGLPQALRLYRFQQNLQAKSQMCSNGKGINLLATDTGAIKTFQRLRPREHAVCVCVQKIKSQFFLIFHGFENY